jgi:antitoxin VapB
VNGGSKDKGKEKIGARFRDQWTMGHCLTHKISMGEKFFSCKISDEYIHSRIYYFMEAEMKTAKVFRSGNSQAVRLPKDFQVAGDEVYLKKQNNVLILIPKSDPWSSLVRSLDHFSKDFMTERIQPDVEERNHLL